ncbi:MAG TPA: inositol oxygenase family protein [Tepidisphaeraceae bacterium]|jgi:inositol oxygenase
MSRPANSIDSNNPLEDLDHWEEFLKDRYPESESAELVAVGAETDVEKAKWKRDKAKFRDYRAEARPSVKEFYRLNHTHQTLDFVKSKHREFLGLDRQKMGVWEAMEYLNTLVDDSDPDTDLTQIEHLLQTAEAIRRDGHPRWMILTGLIHDLGKILCLRGEPQWAVVGDTFPVGCGYSDKVVFPEFFAANPDYQIPAYQTSCGIFSQGCGFDKIILSWGHDEYMFHVTNDYLPREAQYMIRYHSFYAAHKEHGYTHLMNDEDRKMFQWVRKFNPYDLYSKGEEKPSVEKLRPFYEELIAEYFPAKIDW